MLLTYFLLKGTLFIQGALLYLISSSYLYAPILWTLPTIMPSPSFIIDVFAPRLRYFHYIFPYISLTDSARL